MSSSMGERIAIFFTLILAWSRVRTKTIFSFWIYKCERKTFKFTCLYFYKHKAMLLLRAENRSLKRERQQYLSWYNWGKEQSYIVFDLTFKVEVIAEIEAGTQGSPCSSFIRMSLYLCVLSPLWGFSVIFFWNLVWPKLLADRRKMYASQTTLNLLSFLNSCQFLLL